MDEVSVLVWDAVWLVAWFSTSRDSLMVLPSRVITFEGKNITLSQLVWNQVPADSTSHPERTNNSKLYLQTPQGCMGKWVNLETRWTCLQVSRTGRCSPVQRATCTHWREGYVHPRVRLDASEESSISSSSRKLNLVSSVAQPWPNHCTDCPIRDSGCYIKQNKEIFSKIKTEQDTSSEAVFQPFYHAPPPFFTTIEAAVPIAQVLHWTTGAHVFWARIISSETSHLIALWFVSAFSPHLHSCLPSYLFPSVLKTRIIYASSNGILTKGRRQRDN